MQNVEYIYEKPEKKYEKKKIIIFLIVVVILLVLVFNYEWILSVFVSVDLEPEHFKVEHFELPECEEKLRQWCIGCFLINDENTVIWNNRGIEIGISLAECSNIYYGTDWTLDQDCTGNTLETCLGLLPH